jgi:phosphodiesterase/alkaline phosphatase D-like protein
VTLTWTAPAYQGAGNLTYLIYRSTDGTTFEEVGTTTGLSYVDNTPSSSQYYYKVYTRDGANARSSGSNAVTITPTGKWTTPPELKSGPDTHDITTKKATITWTTDRNSDSKIQYGTKSGEYGDVEPSNSAQTTAHSIQLTGLNPGTTYYYKAKWTDEDGNTGISEEKSFTTAPAPVVKDVVARNIGLTGAILQFTSNGASKIRIYYGQSTDFGGVKEISTSTDETTYTAELSNLADGVKYYYKINAFDSEGSEYEGTILDFTTLPRPRISNVRLEQVANTAQTTIRVTWTTNTEVSSIVTYYPQGSPEESRDEVKLTLERGEHSMIVRGLLPETDYYLQVKGRDSQGNEAISDLQRFTTATDTRPPAIINLKVIGGTVPPVGFAAGDIRAQLIVS